MWLIIPGVVYALPFLTCLALLPEQPGVDGNTAGYNHAVILNEVSFVLGIIHTQLCRRKINRDIAVHRQTKEPSSSHQEQVPPINIVSPPRPASTRNRPFCWQVQTPSGQALFDQQVIFSELVGVDTEDILQSVEMLIARIRSSESGFNFRSQEFTIKWKPFGDGVSFAEVRTGTDCFISVFLAGADPAAEQDAVQELFRLAQTIMTGERRSPNALPSQRPLALTLACVERKLLDEPERLELLSFGTRTMAAAFFRVCEAV